MMPSITSTRLAISDSDGMGSLILFLSEAKQTKIIKLPLQMPQKYQCLAGEWCKLLIIGDKQAPPCASGIT
jgi:hypothetical protein